MKFSFTQTVGSRLPEGVAEKAAPLLAIGDNILSGSDDDAVSQRVALSVFIIRVMSAPIAYLQQVLLARMMGTFEYGIFVGVWVAVVILGTIACIGLPTAAVRYVGQYRETQEEGLLRGMIRSSLGLSFLLSTLIAAAGAAILYFVPELVENYYLAPIFLAAICLPMLALQEVQDGIGRAFNWPGLALVPTFIFRPIMILVFMMAAILLGFEANAITAMGSAIAATYVASVGQFLALRGRLKSEVPKGESKYRTREWTLVALPILLVEGFYVLMTSVDILFVSALMTPEKVAVYFAAVKTLALVHFVYFAVKVAASHRFSAYMASENRARLEEYTAQTVRWTFWPSLIFAVVMVLLGKYLLMLFGEGFLEGQGLLWILAIGIVARSAVGPSEAVLTMTGYQNVCAIVYSSNLFINVVLNTILIPKYGLYGAAIATTTAMVFESFALYAATKRKLGLHLFIVPEKYFLSSRESGSAGS